MSKTPNQLRNAWPLILLLILFWGVSFYGLDFGVHWDETRAKFESVKKSIDTGLLLQSSGDPTGYGYNYGGVNYLLTWAGVAPELTAYLVKGPRTREALSDAIGPLVYTLKTRLRVRAIYMFLSSLTIVWLYCLCRVLGRSEVEAFLAAALVSLSWEVQYHSRWVAPDVVMAQFAVLAFLFMAVAMKRRSLGWFYWSAIVVGLTAGTKYPGVFILPFLVVGACYTLWKERPSIRYVAKHAAGLAGATGLAFVLTSPGIAIDPFAFFAQLQEQKATYAFGWYGYTVKPGLQHLLAILKYFLLQGFSHYWSISILLSIFCVLGLIAIAKERRLISFLAAGFCLGYTVFFAEQAAMLVRNLMVVIPFLAFAAARGITGVGQRLGARSIRVLQVVVGLMLVTNLGWEVYAAGQIGNRSDLDYFLRKFEDYARQSPRDTFFVSHELLVDLNRLPDPLPGNLTAKVADRYTKVAFLQTEGADRFNESWPANRWNTYDRIFGGLEVNLEAYPTFIGNERILVLSEPHFARVPVTATYLSTPRLIVDKTEVVAGKDAYVLRIKEAPKSNVFVRYSVNGAAPEQTIYALNDVGETKVELQADMAKGSYRLLAYRKDSETLWHNVDVSIAVK